MSWGGREEVGVDVMGSGKRLLAPRRNWGRNQVFAPAATETPGSVLEVREAIGRAAVAGQRVRVVASTHSFTACAATEGRMLDLGLLDRLLDVEPAPDTAEGAVVTVEAGIPLWKLNEELALRSLALPNLGDIDRQTVAGATSTGTHGTGLRYGAIATAIVGLELVIADGEVLWCSPESEPEVFASARVGLGALGVVTKVALACVPAFNLHALERPMRWDRFLEEWPALVAEHDHVDSYWFPHSDTCSAKVSDRTDEPLRPRPVRKRWRDEMFYANWVFGAAVRAGKLLPSKVPDITRTVASSLGKTEEIDRSDRIFCTRRLVRFVEMEYAIDVPHAMDALVAIRTLIEDEGLRVAFPVEIRALGADDIPLSMAEGTDKAFLAVHLPSGTDYERYFRGVEAIMDRYDGRPHWGKLHFQDATSLAPRYARWGEFMAVRGRLDPEGRFANDYLDRVFGPPQGLRG